MRGIQSLKAIITRKTFQNHKVEILVLIVFCLINLRVLNWFQPGQFSMGGDFRPPISTEAFLQHALNSWNEVDFGVTSVYMPRLIDPLMSLSTAFQTVGADIGTSEMLTIYVIYVLAAMLMYFYVKHLLDGDVVAAFVASLFFITNISLITDREVTAINLMDVALTILPCLLAFTVGIKRKSMGFMLASGFLFTLTYAFFPNSRPSILCVISLGITLLYMAIKKGWRSAFKLETIQKYVRLISGFAVAAVFASIGIIAFVLSNFSVFAATYSETPSTSNVLSYLSFVQPLDTVRLIAQWGFYSGEFSKPYVPYAPVYLSNPLVIALSYIPPLLAFAAAFVSKNRKATAFFLAVSLISLVLVNGVAASIVNSIPLMKAFRVTTNWIFFAVFAFSILIGLTTSALYRKTKNHRLKLLTLLLTATVFFASTYPLFTGDVARNWLNPENKGVQMPPYFSEVENAISPRYWTIILPPRNPYAVYNTTEGLFDAGNPYPLIFTKPILTGIGTEYLQSPSSDLLNNVYNSVANGTDGNATLEYLGSIGIKYLLVENGIFYGNLTSTKNLSLLNETTELKIIAKWNDATLYENPYALEKLYVSGNAQFSWNEKSPTEYEATVSSDVPFTLVFLESYDSNWIASVNGKPVAESNHTTVKGFANAWNINSTGNTTIKLEYRTQSLTVLSVGASIILSACLVAVAYRKRINQVFRGKPRGNAEVHVPH